MHSGFSQSLRFLICRRFITSACWLLCLLLARTYWEPRSVPIYGRPSTSDSHRYQTFLLRRLWSPAVSEACVSKRNDLKLIQIPLHLIVHWCLFSYGRVACQVSDQNVLRLLLNKAFGWHLREPCFECSPGSQEKGVRQAGTISICKAGGIGGTFCLKQLHSPAPCPSLTSSSDMQCFTVKPVMSLPPNYKDKPVPEQILK